MPKGQNYTGELLHFNATRMRLNGSGNLLQFLRSLDNVRWIQLPTITMATLTNREPTVITNLIEQRAQLEVRTTGINEVFSISKIMVYVKPTATGYVQS